MIIVAKMVLFTSMFINQVPANVQAMNELSNAAELYLVYCSPRNKACVTRRAICYGQCGDQSTADEMGYGCSGDIEGHVPNGFRYARWFSAAYATGKTIGGLATKNYRSPDHLACTNRH
jgi:hypothetical protein